MLGVFEVLCRVGILGFRDFGAVFNGVFRDYEVATWSCFPGRPSQSMVGFFFGVDHSFD